MTEAFVCNGECRIRVLMNGNLGYSDRIDKWIPAMRVLNEEYVTILRLS